MNLLRNASVILLLGFGFGMANIVNAQRVSAQDEECCQPGRIESAKHIIAQVEDFKLKASQYHLKANDSINESKKLKGQADRLQALTGAIDGNAPNEYKANLQAFKDHATAYKAHLDKVERDLGHCHASEAAYQAQLKEYTLHAETFHMPPIKPPHICGRLDVTEHQASHMAGSLRADQMRVVSSEVALANAESKLQNSMQASMNADGQLLHRSQLAEEERKLSGEFAGLKTEYELLKIQQNALLGKAAATASKNVHGKVKK